MEIVHRLCPACRKSFSGTRVKVRGLGRFIGRYEHHNLPYQLKEACEAGCYICSRIWKSLSKDEQALVLSTGWWTKWRSRTLFLAEFGTHQGVYTWDQIRGRDTMDFVFGTGSRGWKTVSFDLFPVDGQVNLQGHMWMWLTHRDSLMYTTYREYVESVVLASSTGSEQTWNTIKQWWDTSMEKQRITNANGLTSSSKQNNDRLQCEAFPTRLLDLDYITSVYDDLFLSTTRTEIRNYGYMTLSYRWMANDRRPPGHHWPWELTSKRLNDINSRIKFASLPKAFQDAIVVTRKLRVRYIWIDAMCIIQDDTHDWNMESSKMGLIYKHAICNIAAGAGTVESSLFCTRSSEDLMPLAVNADWDEQPHEDQTDSFPGPSYLIESDYLNHHLSQTLLSKRGWIIQERILSPRIIYFSPEQVFWQEQDLDACEVFPRGFIQRENRWMDRARPRVELSLPWELGNDAKSWDGVIRHYSATSLTEAKDKTLALQGLAQHWSETMSSDRYWAGLWESKILRGLLWRVVDGRDWEASPSHRNAEFQAPSWSWLSVSGKVEASILQAIEEDENQEGIVQAEILKVDLPSQSPGSGLEMRGTRTRICIRGRLKSAKLMYWPMSSLYRNAQELDWSAIDACRSPFGHRLKCSIDDMTHFMARWNNGAPPNQTWNDTARLLIYQLVFPCCIVLGTVIARMSRLGRLAWFGSLLMMIAYPLKRLVCHLTNFGSDETYFLEISSCRLQGAKGLVLQRQSHDGTYCRVGVFTTKRRDFFTGAPKLDIILV